MTVDINFAIILRLLQEQVGSLRSALSMVKPTEPMEGLPGAPSHPECVIDGPLVRSLLAGDSTWLLQYNDKLRVFNAIESDKEKCDVLVVTSLLCMQKKFKLLLLENGSFLCLIVNALKSFASDDVDCRIWYKNCIFALLKSKLDRPRIVSAQLAAAGFTFADQERFEESVAKNPQAASAVGTSTSPTEEWAMDPSETLSLMSALMCEEFVRSLVLVKASESLACISRVSEFRSLVIKMSGVQVMLDGIEKACDNAENLRVALARLAMTTPPHVWTYTQAMGIFRSCHHLLVSANYELFKFEAAIGLTNLLSYSADVREGLANLPDGWSACFDLITSSTDSRVQVAGTELICNLCLANGISDQIGNGKHFEHLKVLKFLLESSDDLKLRLSAGGALAILSSRLELVPVIQRLVTSDDFSILESVFDPSEEVCMRVVSILGSVCEATEDPAVAERLKETLARLKNSRKVHSEQLAEIISSYC